MDKTKEANRIIKKIYVTWGFFVVTFLSFMYCFWHPNILPLCFVFLTLFIFNIFTTLYNLIISVSRRILLEEKWNG